MIEVRQTPVFRAWIRGLRDRDAVAKINIRIRRLSVGNPGDVKPVGGGVSELRVDHGPGYRIYFIKQGEVIAILLCGGDKRTQDRDIERARQMAREA